MEETEKGQEMRRRVSESKGRIVLTPHCPSTEQESDSRSIAEDGRLRTRDNVKVEGGCGESSLIALDEFFKVAVISREKTEDGQNGVLI
ncbi:hypothetical protein CRG98_047594 [Punica granatum]|uniref:Uncharacterized protein n=1 Tax=Punica granatum TaxID=22663 RepID=A0A2I0HK45_PUNGR|nr:hypothetical protein CRG98_047594 [Punica granatum]